jgi:hypothetical protein
MSEETPAYNNMAGRPGLRWGRGEDAHNWDGTCLLELREEARCPSRDA